MKFTRHGSHRKARLDPAWRRPRGLQSKLRLQKKGHKKLVKVGYRGPVSTRDTKKGLVVQVIYNANDLTALDPKTHGIVVGAVGMKKKIQLLTLVKEKKFTLLTGDPQKHIDALTTKFQEQRKAAQAKTAEKEQKQKELEKKAEKEEKKQEKKAPEKLEDAVEKEAQKVDAQPEKSAEEKEKEKVLTKAR